MPAETTLWPMFQLVSPPHKGESTSGDLAPHALRVSRYVLAMKQHVLQAWVSVLKRTANKYALDPLEVADVHGVGELSESRSRVPRVSRVTHEAN